MYAYAEPAAARGAASPVPARVVQRCGATRCGPGGCGHDEGTVRRQALGPGPDTDHFPYGLPPAPPIVSEVLRSPGRPLDPGTRAAMGAAFGHDFSRVRVHTDARAAASADAVDAAAYTVGSDIVFAGGRYEPHTEQGRGLLVHELTHVVQQRSAGPPPADLRVGPADDAHERQAAANARGPAIHPAAPTHHAAAPTAHHPGAPTTHHAGHAGQHAGQHAAQHAAHQGTHGAATRASGIVRRQSGGGGTSGNPIDARARAIITAAASTSVPEARRAIQVVRSIIATYFPGEAGLVANVIFDAADPGLTTTVATSPTATGVIAVGRSFLNGTNDTHFARRVLQVDHELEHIRQHRAGMGGPATKAEREFLAFHREALATELPGTGEMQHATRVALIDAALRNFCDMPAARQTAHASRRTQLLTARDTHERASGRPRTTPPSCP